MCQKMFLGISLSLQSVVGYSQLGGIRLPEVSTGSFSGANMYAAPAATPSVAQTMAPPLATYVLQPEDIIRVQLFNESQVNGALMISREGLITVPFAGSLVAAGKTTEQLRQELVQRFIQVLRLREPIVSIVVEKYRTIRAAVVGMVARPGVYDLRPHDTVQTLLSVGGGAMMNGDADLRRVVLRRKEWGNELIPIDLYSLQVEGDFTQNYHIEDGDELLVPQDRKNQIAVVGAIQRPGNYTYKEPMRIMDAVSMAGGEIRYRSRFSKITVIRKKLGDSGQYDRIEVNLSKFIKEGDATQNIVLKPEDVIFVPDSGNWDIDRMGSLANIIYAIGNVSNMFGLKIFK